MNKFFRGISNLAQKAATFSLGSTRLTGGYTYFFGNGYKWNPHSFNEYVQNGYRNAYVYLVTSKIARVAASMPRHLEDSEGMALEARVSPEFKEALTPELYEKLALNLLITGNAFLVRQETEIPGSQYLGNHNGYFAANVQDVTIQTANGNEWGEPLNYDIQQMGKFPADQVLHIRLPNILERTNWGLSPLWAGQMVYEASNDLFIASASLFDNMGASGVVSAKGMGKGMPMTPDAQEKMQKEWNARNAGAEKFGKWHITTASVDVHQLGMSSKDLELAEHNIEHLRNVCRIYGVDSAMVGDPEHSTYNNKESAEKGFYKDVILPLSYMIDKAISAWMLPDFGMGGSLYVADTSKIEVLNKPDQELSNKVGQELDRGILTVNEAREILYPHLAPLPELQLQPIES